MSLLLLVAVVDDDAKDAERLKDLVEAYFARRETPVLIHVYPDGLDFIRSTSVHDIVFMDIRMDQLDGLDAAHLMRKINSEACLIFVTNMAQFAIKGYEVDALDFILKPATPTSISFLLDKAMKRLSGTGSAAFSLKTPDGLISLTMNEVTFVEVFDHNLIYHTTRGDYTVRGRLSDVMSKLDEKHFAMCNRSFIVNLRHVDQVTSDTLFIGNHRIPISKSHRKELMKRFSSFLGDTL